VTDPTLGNQPWDIKTAPHSRVSARN
jgi:hypothetical protein